MHTLNKKPTGDGNPTAGQDTLKPQDCRNKDICDVLVEPLGWLPSQVRAVLDLRPDKIDREGMAQALGGILRLPPPTISEAPWAALRMFPFSLSPDAYDNEADHEVALDLHWLWTVKVMELAMRHGIDKHLFEAIRRLNILLVVGSLAHIDRSAAIDLLCALDQVAFLKHTRGCWGDDGCLTEHGQELAAMREFMQGGRRD
jgi:hypothetical protein